jgi:hypothetical protein
LNCLDCGGEGASLIAVGGSDPVLRVWDPRKPGKYVISTLFIISFLCHIQAS